MNSKTLQQQQVETYQTTKCCCKWDGITTNQYCMQAVTTTQHLLYYAWNWDFSESKTMKHCTIDFIYNSSYLANYKLIGDTNIEFVSILIQMHMIYMKGHSDILQM